MNYLILFLLIIGGNSFNINVKHAIVYKNPDNDTSDYFGYSLQIFKGNSTEWIRIGAPKGKGTGVVYNCPLDDNTKCHDMDLIQNRAKQAKNCSQPKFNNFTEIFNNSLLGASMDINSQSMTICAPKYSNKYREIRYDFPTGLCFWFDLNATNNFTTFPHTFDAKNYKKLMLGDGRTLYYAFGQAGFSSHLPQDKEELIIGAPGVYNWIGSVIKVKKCQTSTVIPYVYDQGNYLYKLFGYSVTSGYYFGKKGMLFYAASRPKASVYKGEVMLFLFQKYNETLKKFGDLTGTQPGEYFGASLTTGDINFDDYDDLIVGAPFHKTDEFNEGRIYCFLGGKYKFSKPTIIDGTKRGGQFGLAVTFLGDINKDGFGDVAVGAPYEDDLTGAVYIYEGTRTGLKTIFSQKIAGKNIELNIKGFGISISKPADINKNNYNDFAIGAHLSGHAVLLKTEPIVIIEPVIYAQPYPLRNRNNFSLNVCWYIKSFSHVKFALNTSLKIDTLHKRTNFEGISNKILNFTLDDIYITCLVYNVSFKENAETDKEIRTELAFKLLPNFNKTFCKFCPKTDERSAKSPYIFTIPFIKDCGTDNVCLSDLHIVDITIANYSDNVFVMGSSEVMKMIVTVENMGENAYSARLNVVSDDAVLLKNCKQNYCDIKNPLQLHEKVNVTLWFDMTKANKEYFDETINFTFKLDTISFMKNNKTKKDYALKLVREADVTINGYPEEYFFDDKGILNFTQTFKVEKFGISPIKKSKATIRIPYYLSPKSFLNITGANFDKISCNVSYPTVENWKNFELINKSASFNCTFVPCAIIECYLGPFNEEYDSGSITVGVTVNTTAIIEKNQEIRNIKIFIEEEISIVTPQVYKRSGNFSHYGITEITITYLYLEKLIVPIWIIAAAAISGLIILSFIIYGLIKMGFFRRQKKQELELLVAEAELEDAINARRATEEERT